MMKFMDYWIYLGLSIAKLFLFSVYTNTVFQVDFFILNLGSVILLSGWTLLIKADKRRWILLFLLFMHSTLLVSDIWYYRYFGDLLSIFLISDITQIGDVGGGFLTLIQWKDLFFFSDLLLFLAVILAIRKRAPEQRNHRKWAAAVSAAGLLLFAIPCYLNFSEEQAGGAPISNMREYYQLGFWGYHGMDILRGAESILAGDMELTEEQKTLIQQESPNEAKAETTSASPQANVIMIQLESFQDSIIDQQVNGQELTPNLNGLKNEMLYFPSFYQQTHEGRTSDAEFITLTSLMPLKTGSVFTQYAENEFEALPETLQQAGYDTAAMHAYKKDFWNRDNFYKNIGFNHFFSEEDYSDKEKIGMALNDKDFFSESIAHMEQLSEPFFSFLVALTSHTPYEIEEGKQQLDLSTYEDPLLKGYYQTVHYVDEAVGLMVEELKEKEMWDESLIIFYGDHDNGLTKTETEMTRELGAESAVDFFELDRQVPLFIKPPLLTEGEAIEKTGGQIDIAPTILDLLGIEPPYMLGQSLMGEEQALTIFRDGSFRYADVYFEPDLAQAAGQGACYSVSLEKEVPFDECEDQVDAAADQLRISDLIIEENALEKMRNANQ